MVKYCYKWTGIQKHLFKDEVDWVLNSLTNALFSRPLTKFRETFSNVTRSKRVVLGFQS